MNDLIIGAITGYTAKDVMPWLKSIKMSGFTGKTALIIYNMQFEEIEKLERAGLDYAFVLQADNNGNAVYEDSNFNICVQRFIHLWYFLSKYENDFRYVIMTDVKDVVFQSNPSEWILEDNELPEFICVGSENIRYEDEPWSKNNMRLSFGPMIYESMKDHEIFCAGVVAGTKNLLAELGKNIFMYSRGCPQHVPGGGGPDQSAMNILLRNTPWKERVLDVGTKDSFIVHCGTSMAAIKAGSGAIGEEFVRLHTRTAEQIESLLVNPDIQLIDEQVCNSEGLPFTIVHQYDRVPEWKNIILKRYT